jgi:hypothetical protein
MSSFLSKPIDSAERAARKESRAAGRRCGHDGITERTSRLGYADPMTRDRITEVVSVAVLAMSIAALVTIWYYL